MSFCPTSWASVGFGGAEVGGGVGGGVGLGVGFGVGLEVGVGDGVGGGVGRAVGSGVGAAVGAGDGLEIGLTVGSIASLPQPATRIEMTSATRSLIAHGCRPSGSAQRFGAERQYVQAAQRPSGRVPTVTVRIATGFWSV
jgi:hypothetical protein